jgi:hypothetical protein
MAAPSFPITLEDFRERLPEFDEDSYPDATVELALDDAALQINSEAWGTKAGLGQMYLAAHTMAFFGPASTTSPGLAPAGFVTQESVGEISRSYSVPSGGSSSMTDSFQTRYGQMYERLKRQIAATPVVL